MTMPPTLDADLATRLARIALGHVQLEYPNKLDHVMAGPEDALTPRLLHPVFYGSYDWHSCVHGTWMLARLLRRFPEMEAAGAVMKLFDAQLVPEKIGVECAYLARPSARGFERPYGWAWLLKLASELALLAEPRWATALQPLADVIVQRFRDSLPLASYPVRVGTHFNTAFALRLAADYAAIRHDASLEALLSQTALRWYGADAGCSAWGEPGGDEFLSPALIEAECMRRMMPAADFAVWLDRFLPALPSSEPAILLRPPTVSDRSDGKIAHLDGLSLSRAWCWQPCGDLRRKRPAAIHRASRRRSASCSRAAPCRGPLHGRTLACELRGAGARRGDGRSRPLTRAAGRQAQRSKPQGSSSVSQ